MLCHTENENIVRDTNNLATTAKSRRHISGQVRKDEQVQL